MTYTVSGGALNSTQSNLMHYTVCLRNIGLGLFALYRIANCVCDSLTKLSLMVGILSQVTPISFRRETVECQIDPFSPRDELGLKTAGTVAYRV